MCCVLSRIYDLATKSQSHQSEIQTVSRTVSNTLLPGIDWGFEGGVPENTITHVSIIEPLEMEVSRAS